MVVDELAPSYDLVLEALGDTTRREILERLRRGPASVGELAAGLPVTRPAVSQHLKVLQEAGLVRARHEGTRNIYAADPGGLAVLRQWLDGYWQDVLDAFADHVARAEAGRSGGRRR